MSLLRLFSSFAALPAGRRAEDVTASYAVRDVTSDFWYELIDRPTASRVSVTPETALTYSVVFACTRLLSVPSILPLNLYRRDPGQTEQPQDDSQFVMTDDPRNAMVNVRPNPDMIGVLAKAQAFQQQVNAGNAYFEIERNKAGQPIALWPIHHSRVTPVYDEESGELLYRIANNKGGPVYIDKADILHFPYPVSRDGIVGVGVITKARESIGMGLVTERHGAQYFGAGGLPRIVVKHPNKISPDARKNFHKEWKENLDDSNRIALLMEGADLKEIAVSNDDSQFLATREFNVEELARWYNVPLHLLQRNVNPGVNNVEALSIEFQKFSLMPLTVIWEQELNVKLLTVEERKTMYFRFDFAELLRPDSKTLSEVQRTQIQVGVLTPDEARVQNGRNPKGGAAAGLFMQGAMLPIDKLGQQLAGSQAMLPANDKEQDGVDTAAMMFTLLQRQALDRGHELACLQRELSSLRQDFASVVFIAHEAQVASMNNALGKVTDTITGTVTEEGKATRDLVSDSGETIQATTKQAVGDGVVSVTGKVESLDASLAEFASRRDTREAVVLDAARKMLLSAVHRMVRNQATAARKAANKPKEFMAWLDRFFDDDHRRNFSEAVEPAAGALATMLGVAVCAKTLAEREVAKSYTELLELSGTCFNADELSAKVDARMVEWESKRAAAVCEAVIGGQAA